MKNMLIYYGWLNSYNSADNSWTNEKVAQDFARYGILILGDGIQDSNHGDYANTQIIIPRIQALNINTLIFGYVSVNQTFANFKTKVDGWSTLDVDGIFMDEAGYDYGTTATNSREEFNRKVDYIHSKDMVCFVNAWKIQHVLGTEEDQSYVNSTWNANTVESNLDENDWYLMESFAITSAGAYEAKAQWLARGEECSEYREEYGINLAGSSVIANGDNNGSDKFDFIYVSGCMWDLEAVGSSDTSYGAGTAASKMWTRPDVSPVYYFGNKSSIVVDGGDADVYLRYFEHGILKIDFSSGAELVEMVDYE